MCLHLLINSNETSSDEFGEIRIGFSQSDDIFVYGKFVSRVSSVSWEEWWTYDGISGIQLYAFRGSFTGFSKEILRSVQNLYFLCSKFLFFRSFILGTHKSRVESL